MKKYRYQSHPDRPLDKMVSASRSVTLPSGRRPLWRAHCQFSYRAAIRPLSPPTLSSSLSVSVSARLSSRRSVPTSPVVPTLSQPPEGVGDTKRLSKTTVSPTSPRGPNLLLHIHVGERKRSGTCFSIRKEKDPRWGHRGWDHIRPSHWSKTIKACPNPLEGWDHALGGWDRDGQRVDHRLSPRPRSFSL